MISETTQLLTSGREHIYMSEVLQLPTQGLADKYPHTMKETCFLETGPEPEGVEIGPRLWLWRAVLNGNFTSGKENKNKNKKTDTAFYLGYCGWKCSRI